ncbi:MAG: phosphatase PAP2 family protein [Gammaproteobacteria bacterium]|nr:phosphatase PAP2 family protein [Gammaproteobacteria bacterium]MBU1555145.1 phosphatase PAP2 family protein [Gammaproteobacteria bacterium]MBU2070261.1 phosphatase PAP2 family protein [Gammaproteobacteria bacterium]MBU2183964.1 phosphatase PAP2 family protein [Gammaproteobacteria bacterium]MBU2206768.1 phosphatase PAP2 family protein [Gammaproteobacteria bacterium]
MSRGSIIKHLYHLASALLLCLVPLHNACASTEDTAADVLRVALPAAAWGMTHYLDDAEGSKQFYYSFAATVATTLVLKTAIHKNRPDGSDNDAFPSGHTSMAFQAAAFMQRRYGWQYGVPAYALATYVGYSRVNNDHHDSRDVLAGALIGIAASYYFVEPFYGVQVTPTAGLNGVGLQLSATW